ncbi:hypothetical protein LX64_01128 [Chitinophaga skermanii]|uniref:Helix-hairpin-helix protein n=1 Tax=Chitinophaga skermanii TaxID=331697 RepID=A0A327QUX4_9BACT|nr:hypothetical protein [Chitinophaga skermanii]RAJ08476.1 hypothetical protein LX64_01128 [Chitinophaga skermanii]
MKKQVDPIPLPKLAKPAQRALQAHHIACLQDLCKYTLSEFAAWHAIGPNAIAAITAAMNEHGLHFATSA